MAAIRFFASGFRRHQNYHAPRQLAAGHTSDPETLPFFCYAGCPGIDHGAVGLLAPVQLEPPVALGLPMHSYLPHVSSLPTLPACSSAAFATEANLFCIHCKTKQWPVPRSPPHRSSLWSSTGSGNPGLFHLGAARTRRAAAACLASSMCC